jgi:isopentenyldiphosphate isomerase
MSTAACASSPFQGTAVVGLAVRRRRKEEGIRRNKKKKKKKKEENYKDNRETSYRSQWTKQQRKDLFIVFSFYSQRAPSLCIDIGAAAAAFSAFYYYYLLYSI